MSVIQPGDIINIGRLAWDIYEYGWSSELAASVQYAQFGSEFRHLAKNLDILVSVVRTAQESLINHGVTGSRKVMWDRESLIDIVGDYHGTLEECRQLLEDNEKYSAPPSDPLDNLKWHVFVQPSADRLKHRIQLQNVRIQAVLKPFEIDLLTQIHKDLAQGISAIRDDVLRARIELRSFMGVLVPDLKAELDQKDELRKRLPPVPPVPPEIEQELEAVFCDHPRLRQDECQYPPLRDIADAFVVSLELSTKSFKPGLTIVEKTPPVDKYINLLICLFLLKKMEASKELQKAPERSHWPSYVQELKERASHEWDRFHHSMCKPSFRLVDVDKDTLYFWVEDESDDIDVVTLQVMMENLMDVPLFTKSSEVSKRLRLMRHTGTGDQKYRLILSTEKRQATRRPPQQEVEDFDVTMAVLKPLYALPSVIPPPPFEMALEANSKIYRLPFSTLEDAFLFQRGVTGFRVADCYFQPDMTVRFVTKRRVQLHFEKASAQIWIHDRLGGELVPDKSDSVSPIDTPPSPTLGRRRTLPSNSTDQPSRRPSHSSLDMTPGQESSRCKWWMPKPERKPSLATARTLSVSSASTEGTSQSTPSSISDTMVAVLGLNGVSRAPVHIRPRNPMLVLFTQDPGTKSCAIDIVSINDDTRPSKQGESQKITTLEPSRHLKTLEARRLYSPTCQWDLLCLCVGCKHRRIGCSVEAWGDLIRISILFPEIEARFRFSGIFCSCRRRTLGEERECMEKGHFGQLGKAAVYYRQRMIKYHSQLNRQVQHVTYEPIG